MMISAYTIAHTQYSIQKGGESMTPQEKARERKRAAAEAERELIRKSLLEVLASEDATPAQKLESSKLLLGLGH